MRILQYLDLYTTQKGAELTDFVLVKKEADEGWTVALRVFPKDVRAGDILHVAGKVQRTNNLHKAPWNLTGGRNVGCGFRFALISPAASAPVPLTNWTGSNVDMAIHHQPSVDIQIWRAPQDYGDATVTLQVKCGSTNAVETGPKRWKIELDRGYGHLSVLHQRPIEWPPA